MWGDRQEDCSMDCVCTDVCGGSRKMGIYMYKTETNMLLQMGLMPRLV